MRKEVLIAILVGFALGLVITFGIWSANKALNNQPTAPSQTSDKTLDNQNQTQATPTPIFSLVILKPEDESIANTDKITVSGSTVPLAQVVITSEKNEEILEADDQGAFSTQVTLVSGTNEINITAFSETGDEVSKTINVVYSTSEI